MLTITSTTMVPHGLGTGLELGIEVVMNEVIVSVREVQKLHSGVVLSKTLTWHGSVVHHDGRHVRGNEALKTSKPRSRGCRLQGASAS